MRPRSRPPNSRMGFTLIELLVVIAIIAILAAILFPVFAKAREKARQITCVSNLKQISLATLQYSQDYDERCPMFFSGCNVTPGSRTPGYSGPCGGPPNQYWTELIQPYVQRQASHNFNTASKVFVCPSSPYDSAAVTAQGISNISSYGMSDNWAEWYCPADCNNGTGTAHSFVEAVAPANTVLFEETMNSKAGLPGFDLAFSPIDGGNSGATYYGNCKAANQGKYSLAREFVVASWRHSSSKSLWCEAPPDPSVLVVVAYADGHVKAEHIGTLQDFKKWAILQGNGDVGCVTNVDGTKGCWYP